MVSLAFDFETFYTLQQLHNNFSSLNEFSCLAMGGLVSSENIWWTPLICGGHQTWFKSRFSGTSLPNTAPTTPPTPLSHPWKLVWVSSSWKVVLVKMQDIAWTRKEIKRRSHKAAVLSHCVHFKLCLLPGPKLLVSFYYYRLLHLFDLEEIHHCPTDWFRPLWVGPCIIRPWLDHSCKLLRKSFSHPCFRHH